MSLLKKGDIAVVALTKERIAELLNEAIVENIASLANVENDLTDLVVSVQYFDDDTQFPVLVFAAEDSESNMLNYNYAELAERIIKRNICKENMPIYINNRSAI